MPIFDEWYKEVLAIVKENRPIYLMGRPDPNEPEEYSPMSDEDVERWDKENRIYFEKYYIDGDSPHLAITEFVAGL